MRPAIIVMTKAPRAGQVKTRLCPTFSPDEIAELAACFIQDTLQNTANIPASLIIAYDLPDGLNELASYAPKGALGVLQEGDGLGQRQEHALAYAASRGYGPIVLTGTDSPTLPAAHVIAALKSLGQDAADVVLGPAPDGGYCVLGVQGPLPGIFDGVAWSTESVCSRIQKNAAARGQRVRLLPPWYDVDIPEDLRRLWGELCRSTDARARAPATFRWLQAQAASHPFFR